MQNSRPLYTHSQCAACRREAPASILQPAQSVLDLQFRDLCPACIEHRTEALPALVRTINKAGWKELTDEVRRTIRVWDMEEYVTVPAWAERMSRQQLVMVKKTEETLKKTKETPKKTKETPKKTEETPKKTKETLKKTEETPKKTKETPKKTKETLKKTEETLKKTEETPKKTEETPKKTEETPKKTEEALSDPEDQALLERLHKKQQELITPKHQTIPQRKRHAKRSGWL